MKLESWKRAERRQIRAELRQLAKEERQRQQKALQVSPWATPYCSMPHAVCQNLLVLGCKCCRTLGPVLRSILLAESMVSLILQHSGWHAAADAPAAQEVLDGAQVLCCTLTGALHPQLQGQAFDVVVIDEAAQALEVACWSALLKGRRAVMAGRLLAENCTACCFAGDPSLPQ